MFSEIKPTLNSQTILTSCFPHERHITKQSQSCQSRQAAAFASRAAEAYCQGPRGQSQVMKSGTIQDTSRYHLVDSRYHHSIISESILKLWWTDFVVAKPKTMGSWNIFGNCFDQIAVLWPILRPRSTVIMADPGRRRDDFIGGRSWMEPENIYI